MNIKICGLYKIKDSYFKRFSSKFLIHNKAEQRPFYCAVRGEGNIIWFVPLSTQVQSYKIKIAKDENRYGGCLFYHIGKIAGVERVFLIGNAIPVSVDYIKSEFTIEGIHYVIKDKELTKAVSTKLKRYLVLVQNGKMKPKVDVMQIKSNLK